TRFSRDWSSDVCSSDLRCCGCTKNFSSDATVSKYSTASRSPAAISDRRNSRSRDGNASQPAPDTSQRWRDGTVPADAEKPSARIDRKSVVEGKRVERGG